MTEASPSDMTAIGSTGMRLRRMLGRGAVQLSCGLILVAITSLAFAWGDLSFLLFDPNAFTTLILGLFGLALALVLFRRVEIFPGVGVMSNVLPAVTISLGIVMTAILALRLEYGRLTLAGIYVVIFLFLVGLGLLNRSPSGQVYYLLPGEGSEQLARIPGVRWFLIRDLAAEPAPEGIIIADLRVDFSEDWERRITQWVLAGHRVYHSKQVFEMMTGRVQIEHLSENSLGSLAPSETFAAFKRVFDIVLSLALLPVLLPLFAVTALAIRLDDGGPVFFRQDRVGYRGTTFRVIKFRTMKAESDSGSSRDSAKTADDDRRITRVGRTLRRTRIDELPQVFNVLRGEMSWIGPRPEAVPLSLWYASELPFYPYRHVVRPGITGWAQVNQGHVTELDEVLDKLHYDFYYIKNFSAWIDLTILIRTVFTVLTGFGAR